jgi:SAM-dependent methyltransferase
MTTDEILEKLSMNLPFGLGRAHARAIARWMDQDTRSCLDIGCGRGAFSLFRHYETIGCDIYSPNLAIAKGKGFYADLVHCDVRCLPFKPKSFDITICIEVIEHLDKKEGLELIKRMEEMARRQVIITTPWGYYPLDERHDNPYLNHISGWLPEDFERMGYRVYPFYYPRYPVGSRKSQILARYVLSPIIYPLVRLFPQSFALDFMAVKKLK